MPTMIWYIYNNSRMASQNAGIKIIQKISGLRKWQTYNLCQGIILFLLYVKSKITFNKEWYVHHCCYF